MKDFKRILGLDPASSCGYAYIDVKKGFQIGIKIPAQNCGVWDLHQGRWEGAGMRYVRFKKFLLEIEPDIIFFEEVRQRFESNDAACLYGGLRATLASFCEEHNIPYQGIPVGTIKKRATGKGNAGKPMMVEAANKFFGTTLDATHAGDDDISDALWIAQIGLEEYASALV